MNYLNEYYYLEAMNLGYIIKYVVFHEIIIVDRISISNTLWNLNLSQLC